MPDVVSSEDRQLIDDAISQGAVTVCPPGHRTSSLDFVWCERKGKLVNREPEVGRSNFLYFGGSRALKMFKRRQRVRRYLIEGKSLGVIAKLEGVSYATIRNDKAVLDGTPKE